jgi:hypothetical protein
LYSLPWFRRRNLNIVPYLLIEWTGKPSQAKPNQTKPHCEDLSNCLATQQLQQQLQWRHSLKPRLGKTIRTQSRKPCRSFFRHGGLRLLTLNLDNALARRGAMLMIRNALDWGGNYVDDLGYFRTPIISYRHQRLLACTCLSKPLLRPQTSTSAVEVAAGSPFPSSPHFLCHRLPWQNHHRQHQLPTHHPSSVSLFRSLISPLNDPLRIGTRGLLIKASQTLN